MTTTYDLRLYSDLVDLADWLVAGFDAVDLSDRLMRSCLNLLPVVAGGILLNDSQGNLRVLASTSEELRLLEVLEVQRKEGPCLEAFLTGEICQADNLDGRADDWPVLSPALRELGFTAAYAVPLRLRHETIGAINLFCDGGRVLVATDLDKARLLANIATIAIITHRADQESSFLTTQLQHALDSRVVIEQAKGVLAQREKVDMAAAFQILRANARSSRQRLTDVAHEIVASAHLDGPEESPRVSAEPASVPALPQNKRRAEPRRRP